MVLAKLKPRLLLFNRHADCTKYFYDVEGKIIGWKYQDQTRATQVHDAVGQRTQVKDWTGRYTYSFDAVGRTLLAVDSFAKRITYGYDAVGQRAKMREPDGGRFTYWYDGVGQITRLLNPFQENTTFTYDVAGRRTMQKLANRVRASYSYDAADRLTTLANVRADGTYVSRYDYAYDNTSNKTRVIEANGDRLTWSYDQTSQLTRERRSGANAYDTTYIYDTAQNRRLMIDSGTRTTYVCDAANQLNWLQDNTGRTTFSYDANGNQTLQIVPSLVHTTNVWDGENLLTRVRRSSTDRSTYTYKSDTNLRVVAEEATTTSRIIWDGQVYLEEANASDATQAIYSNEPTQYGILVSQRRLVSSFYQTDALHSINHITSTSATLTDSQLNTAFGITINIDGSTINPFGYTGALGYYSTNSLLYIRRRWYTPTIGAWISVDKLTNDKYAYSYNNPLRFHDPSGLVPIGGIAQKIIACALICKRIYDRKNGFPDCFREGYGKTLCVDDKRNPDFNDFMCSCPVGGPDVDPYICPEVYRLIYEHEISHFPEVRCQRVANNCCHTDKASGLTIWTPAWNPLYNPIDSECDKTRIDLDKLAALFANIASGNPNVSKDCLATLVRIRDLKLSYLKTKCSLKGIIIK